MRLLLAALLCLQAGVLPASSVTVESIRKAGALTCGIDQSEAEYSNTDEHGSRVAFDRDVCRAVAVAILGPHARVEVKGYPDNETALEALASREVDLVATVNDDFSHSTLAGVSLTRPVLFDGQGFMVLRSSGIAHAAQLDRRKICFLDQSEAELDVHAWFQRHRLTFTPFPFQEQGEMEAAFVTRNCTALAGDLTRLANARVAFGSRAGEYMLLPETIASDPLAMAFRADDPAFGPILNTVINVLLAADELNVSSKNLDHLRSAQDPAIRRLIEVTPELARPLGLADGWPADVLREVGNYGEIFARDLGQGSPLKLAPPLEGSGRLHSLPLK